MFFNSQNPMFPFQMPNMNGQMPFPFPFQMPNMNGQMPFPFPFPFQPAAKEGEGGQPAFDPMAFFQQMMQQMPFQFPFPFQPASKEGDGGQPAFDPMAFFQQMMQQMPFQFPFPFQPAAETKEAPAEGEEAQPDAQQPFNPFAFLQQMAQMSQLQQFMDMFKNMPAMFGMNPQNCSCQQAFNPFAFFQQMPQPQLPQLPTPQQFADMLKKLFEQFTKGFKQQDNGMPFGIPLKLMQILLYLDSSPEGLSKFQKILDLIFDEYSKNRTPSAE